MSILTDFRQAQREAADVLAKHEQAASVTDFAKYADDPAGFMRDVLRCEPWKMQVTMAEALRDHPRVVVVTANGVGKDWATARICLWWVYARRGFVILTGPTERQVKQILMREIRKAFAHAPELPGELLSLELRVDDAGECGMLAMTSDNADKLTGFHHPRLLICVTEGQGVEDDAYEAALACCTGEENKLFVYGNPTNPLGFFHNAAVGSSWHSITIPATSHPNIVSGREEIPGAISQAWIDAIAEEYGVGSPIYNSRVLAQFPGESAGGLLKREWIRAAFARHESGELVDESRRHPLFLALDVARFGEDSCVCAWVRGPVVEKLVSWHGSDLVETAEKVAAFATASYSPTDSMRMRFPQFAAMPTIIVDEPGMGGGVIDVLRKMKPNWYGDSYKVIAFNGAHAAFKPDRFLNCRAETHWVLREQLERGKIALPRDASLEQEALAIEWQLNPAGGKVQILSKDRIRETLKRSPDRLDAVVMGLSRTVGKLHHTMHVGRFGYGPLTAVSRI